MSWFLARVNASWTYSTFLPPNDRLTSNHECERWTQVGTFAARSRHPGGVQMTLADSSVRFVSDSIDIDIWRFLGSRNGRETINASQF